MGHKGFSSDIHIITQQLSKIIDTPIEDSLTRLVGLSKRMFDVPVVAISMFDEKRQKYNLINTHEIFGKKQDFSVFKQYINDDVLIIEDTRNDERFMDSPLFLDDLEMRFYVSCPIYGKKRKKIGAIVLLDNQPRPFCLTDLDNLNDIIKLAEAEINNCRLSKAQKLLLDEVSYDRRIDYTDQKTRAWNFNGFRKILTYQIAESIQFNTCFGLVAVDIDHLKKINDTHGTDVGDEILKDISKTLMRTCRAEDTIARGDFSDFIVLIHTNTIGNIKSIVERIHCNLTKLVPKLSTGKINLKTTIGYSCFDPKVTRPDQLLTNTEIAMLKGKRAGRNCINFHIDNDRLQDFRTG